MEKAEAKLDSIIIFPNFVDFFFFSLPLPFASLIPLRLSQRVAEGTETEALGLT